MPSEQLNHLTPEERARLRELASKATPAPWRWAVERHAVLRLLDEIERRPPPLVWSKEPPEVSDRCYCWCRWTDIKGEPFIVELRRCTSGRIRGDFIGYVDEHADDLEYAGPIPQPSEASE